MNRKDVIATLEMENELICFNPLTGEEIELAFVSELNRKCYDAHCSAISLIQNSIPRDWIEKWTDKLFQVINGRKYYMGEGHDTVWDMLEDWEKENE